MENLKEQATVMRKAGMSYSEIVVRMGVPRSTLSSWFKSENWSNEIAIKNAQKARNGGAMRLIVLNTVRGNRLRKIYADAAQDALVDFNELKYHPLFIAGVMTYWAHGDKTTKHRISITSSDPKVIKIFYMFIKDVCAIENISLNLLFGPKADEKAYKEYWSHKMAINIEKIRHSVIIQSRLEDGAICGRKSKQNSHGICKLNVNSAYLKHKILKWIDLLADDLIGERYREGIGV